MKNAHEIILWLAVLAVIVFVCFKGRGFSYHVTTTGTPVISEGYAGRVDAPNQY